MIMKLYLDAGLKELIELLSSWPVGASVMQATNFDKTHHFLMQVWEAFYLQQISAILKYAEENDLNDQSEENYIKKLVHYIPFRAKVLGNIKDQLECKRKDFNNSVNRPSFEIQNITSYRESIESGLFFRYENGQLKHAFNSKVVLTDIQRSDLLNLQKIAQEHLGKYIKICQSDGIFRYNKTRKIATFSTKTHSISKVKRELKDQRTENSLLRKQIAWSKEQNTPISDLQQFISLPRAIVDHDGLPYKENHIAWISKIREALYSRVPSEEFYLPSFDALFLHWKRSYWVSRVWIQAYRENVQYPSLTDFGWKLEIDGQLDVIWDSPENLQKVINNIKLWTAGCNCLKSDCNSKICGCKKINMACGPGCKCGSSCKNKNVNSQVCNTEETEENTAEAVASTRVLYNSESDGSDFGDDTMDGSVFFELQNVDDDDLENIIFNFQYQQLA
ncbi:unnamed protein product [Mytilus edulis]|uniref:Tesmin/TSO1-like CXC domain-containing protein n=1 Tax=Mytilus edulis TaxID=6550 RepID=A0A8S3S0Y2_MYTED|nr:unnamed protein product [Mytilus edulis]